MMSLATIDNVALIRVTGGAGSPPTQPQPQAGPPSGSAPQASAGGNILEQFQQIIAFLQNPQFQSVLGGLQQILAALTPQQGGPAPATGDQGQQQAAA